MKYCIGKNGIVQSMRLNGHRRMLRPTLMRNGYRTISISQAGIRPYVHRLVAYGYIKGDRTLVINHKDGNKLNNCVSNLEWVTRAENNRHAWDTGLLMSSPAYHVRKLTEEQANEIRERLRIGESMRTIAKTYGVTKGVIDGIKYRGHYKK